jgi:hypothetical protein
MGSGTRDDLVDGNAKNDDRDFSFMNGQRDSVETSLCGQVPQKHIQHIHSGSLSRKTSVLQFFSILAIGSLAVLCAVSFPFLHVQAT